MAVGSVGKRKAERRDCHVKAQAQFADGRDPVDCIILNFSATGARAKLVSEAPLPPRFKLFSPSRPETKPVLLRWRNGLEFGCEYSSGSASEEILYSLAGRIDKLEARGAGGAPQESSEAALDALSEIDARLLDVESRLRETAAPAADDALIARIAELEARLAQAPAPVVHDAAVLTGLQTRLQELEARVSNAPDPATIERTLSDRLADLETRMAAPVPAGVTPDVLETRLMELESRIAASLAPAGPDPVLVKRIAELEARITPARPTPLALDLSPLEKRIDAVSRASVDAVARLEKFLGARIDDVAASAIAAPSAPPARGADVGQLEQRLIELELQVAQPVVVEGLDALVSRVDGLDAASARFDAAAFESRLCDIERKAAEPAPVDAGVRDQIAALAERLSNLEVSLLELRAGIPEGAGELDVRVAAIEHRQSDVMDALRSVLAMLTQRAERRAAS